MLNRRHAIAAVAAFAAQAGFARAQTTVDGWPSRPIRVIYPTGPGGPTENFRLYTDYMKAVFGQPFLSENMPGASGSIGALAVARSAPDGHTMLVGSNSATILAPLVFEKHQLDVKRDLIPVALLFNYRFLLVANPKLGVRTYQEFVDYARAHQGQLNFGSPGIGTGGHLVTELMLKRAGIQAVHVPYQATTQQLLAAAGGHLNFTFDTVGNARGLVEGGNVTALAVTGKGRAAAMPNVPSFGELGVPGFDGLFVSTSLLVPTGTPAAIVAALNREILVCQTKPDIKQRMEQGSYEQGFLSVAETASFFDADIKNWGEVVRETGVRIKS